MVRGMYILFLGILIAAFVGVGIASFYEAPVQPVYTPYPQAPNVPIATDSGKIMQQEREMQKQQEVYTAQSALYNRNVSLISLIAAVAILMGSIIFSQRLYILADGLLLGSSITLIYSIGRGFAAHDNIYQFLVVSVSLGVVLFIGYIKFLRQQK